MNPFGAAAGLGMNPFGAATGLGKANASVDSALERAVDGTANTLARIEMGASDSAAAVGSAAARGVSAVSSAGSSVASRAGGVAAASKSSKSAAPKKGLGIRMPRAHLGTTPMKFSFQAQDLKVALSTVGFEGRLVLAFKRGNDRRETEPMQLTEEVHYCVDSAWTLCDPNHALLRGQCMLHTAWTLCMTLTLTLI